jgi:hypothetical protein
MTCGADACTVPAVLAIGMAIAVAAGVRSTWSP